jgi:hypothetical protein
MAEKRDTSFKICITSHCFCVKDYEQVSLLNIDYEDEVMLL